MCNTSNDQDAGSCKYCGYIFESFGTTGVDALQNQEKAPAKIVDASFSSTPISTNPPIFVVSKNMFTAVFPIVLYLFFMGLFGLTSPYVAILIVFFILIAVGPILLSPRRYEFYDGFLKMHKIIGGDSEVSYSSLALYPSRPGSRIRRVMLFIEGQRRPIAVPGNPTNQQLGQDLNQFLEGKLKKYEPKPKDEQSQEKSETSSDNATSNDSKPQ